MPKGIYPRLGEIKRKSILTPEQLKEKILSLRTIKSSPDGRFQDCWYYDHDDDGRGYGRIDFQHKTYRLHRISAFVFNVNKDINGIVIVEKFTLDNPLKTLHHCDNRICLLPPDVSLSGNWTGDCVLEGLRRFKEK